MRSINHYSFDICGGCSVHEITGIISNIVGKIVLFIIIIFRKYFFKSEI